MDTKSELVGPARHGAFRDSTDLEADDAAEVERVLRAIRQLLMERFQVAPEHVHLEADLVTDLGIDPQDAEELPLVLEEAFEINISNADAERLSRVADAVRCVLHSPAQ